MRLSIAAVGAALLLTTTAQAPRAPDLESVPYAPRNALCYRATSPPAIDGKLNDEAWTRASWSQPFVDIEGDRRPAPRLQTRVKLLWDADHLYIAADMEEPDVWATISRRDAVVFHDNDFEVFIDPDGDTHDYYELEVNALGTPWDLMLVRPYRDGGPPINAWDITGLKLGVDVRGTLNQAGDRDEGWSVEMALPWVVLQEAALGKKPPVAGDTWRLNFSRVEWQVDASSGTYAKKVDPATKAPVPEFNWVWSPQGAIDMHMPERWGFVQFADAPATPGAAFVPDPNDRVKWALRRLYYRQRDARDSTGKYATSLEALGAGSIRADGGEFRPSMQVTQSSYEITAAGAGGTLVHIRDDGRVWVTR